MQQRQQQVGHKKGGGARTGADVAGYVSSPVDMARTGVYRKGSTSGGGGGVEVLTSAPVASTQLQGGRADRARPHRPTCSACRRVSSSSSETPISWLATRLTRRSFRSSFHTMLRSLICQATAQGAAGGVLVLVVAGLKMCSMVALLRLSSPEL